MTQAFKGQLNPISIKNETAAWKYIDNFATEKLGKYRTTIEEDDAILEKDMNNFPLLGWNERNSILFRRSEKLIFQFLKE